MDPTQILQCKSELCAFFPEQQMPISQSFPTPLVDYYHSLSLVSSIYSILHGSSFWCIHQNEFFFHTAWDPECSLTNAMPFFLYEVFVDDSRTGLTFLEHPT